ncbi:D-beta-D-heptose 1-phosphate adenosyltransferase [Geodermatophilus sp. Leaf369]|uniref:DeoR/GlpR family DNA-binding transcription regulator n=1 Tax=Geodermatophilus sp. Leaf369 TaxID=1736354 RepID=UPI0006F71DBB|nr:DeoR/GlpR family DNA-binding transcription regulator [Geodermatophilus sp. Leaf369]KQS60446.1 D-beta-D-heptose 1-phosphate adenosyltransferase [Geodermatophilus sp. Leaf369]
MYAEERQEHILRAARSVGRVEVAELAAELDVAPETIRKDLTALERVGVLRRVHGGAIPVERLGFEPAVAARDVVLTAEKERIAKAAIAELPDEGAVLIDAGTTTARLADHMPTDRELTVVTNSLQLAGKLAAFPALNVLLLGGRVRSRTLASVDAWALSALAGVYVDLALLATNGVSVERGLTTPDPAEAAIKTAMIGASRRVVLLADHSKVGHDHFAHFGDLDAVDLLITDTGLDERTAAELADAGPRVHRV